MFLFSSYLFGCLGLSLVKTANEAKFLFIALTALLKVSKKRLLSELYSLLYGFLHQEYQKNIVVLRKYPGKFCGIAG
jgi:hypothetical protein